VHDSPVFVDVVVAQTEFVTPPAVTVEMAKGFTSYIVKAIMYCRDHEIVDLANTSPRR
jgi:pyruvate dehydrogenase (quinone)